MDDIPPHSAYCNCAYEQENQQTNDSVPMLKTSDRFNQIHVYIGHFAPFMI